MRFQTQNDPYIKYFFKKEIILHKIFMMQYKKIKPVFSKNCLICNVLREADGDTTTISTRFYIFIWFKMAIVRVDIFMCNAKTINSG